MIDRKKFTQDHGRVKLTQEQVRLLNEFYHFNPRPNTSERICLSQKLGIGLDKIKNWFQNRRAKEKKDSHDSLHHNYGAIAGSNKRMCPNIFPSCNDLYRRRSTF